MTTKKNGGKTRSSKRILYSVEFKLRAVKLLLEEGYTTGLIAGELCGIARRR